MLMRNFFFFLYESLMHNQRCIQDWQDS